jgi:peroxiredoxin
MEDASMTRKLEIITITGLALLVLLPLQARAAALQVGDKAPNFTLPDQDGHDITLRDFAGRKNVVLAFYVLAFTSGWTQELKAYQSDIARFEKTGTQVLGVSVDSVPTNRAFAKQIGITFPLLSDFQRKVSEEYGVLNPEHGFANRTTFVISKNGVIQHIDKQAEALNPNGAMQSCSVMAHHGK